MSVSIPVPYLYSFQILSLVKIAYICTKYEFYTGLHIFTRLILECILFPNYNVIFLIKINVLWLKTIMRFAKEPEMKVENKMWDMIYL